MPAAKVPLLRRVFDSKPPVKEDRMPSKDELRPGVAISTFASWEEVAKWERRNVRLGCCDWRAGTQGHRPQSENSNTRRRKAIARELTHWVRTNIRYVSSGDRHDFTPNAPGAVCKNRFGDCKDGSQLLAVLLKDAGIASGFVSLSPLGDGQINPEVPSPLTTHAILYVPIDGKDHWIDTTAVHAAWDFLPYSDCDRIAYVVDDKTMRLTRTPKFTPADNRTATVTKMTFDANGTSHNVRSIDYFGDAALSKRDEWIDASTKERRRLIRGDILDSHSRATLGEPLEIDERSLPAQPRRSRSQAEVLLRRPQPPARQGRARREHFRQRPLEFAAGHHHRPRTRVAARTQRTVRIETPLHHRGAEGIRSGESP